MTTAGIHRRFMLSATLGAVVAAGAFLWFLATGFGGFFFEAPQGGFFDAQARAWFRGEWGADADAYPVERFNIDGEYHMNFGPFPSALRMPVMAATEALDGKMTGLSLMLGLGALFAGVASTSWRIRTLVRSTSEALRTECLMVAGFVALLGLGSSVLVLSASIWVYDESILWGAAWAVWILSVSIAHIGHPDRRTLAKLSVLTTLAIMSRVSAGAVGIALLCVLFALQAMHAAPSQRVRALARRVAKAAGTGPAMLQRRPWPTLAAGALPVALFAYVNQVRFGTWFSFPFDKQDQLANIPERVEVLEANGIGLVSWHGIPTNTVHYLRPDGAQLEGLFPWVTFARPPVLIGNVARDPEGLVTSFTVSTTALMALAVIGMATIFLPSGRAITGLSRVESLRLPSVAALTGFFPALVVPAASERYKVDLTAFLVVAGTVGAYALASISSRHFRRGAVVIGTVVLLSLANVWIILSLTLNLQRGYRPWLQPSERADFVLDRIEWTERFGLDPNVSLTRWDHPQTLSGAPTAPLGSFLMVGDCAGIHISSGRAWMPLRFEPNQLDDVCDTIG